MRFGFGLAASAIVAAGIQSTSAMAPVTIHNMALDAVTGVYALTLAGRPACEIKLTNELWGSKPPFNAYMTDTSCLDALNKKMGAANTALFWQFGPTGDLVLSGDTPNGMLTFSTAESPDLYTATIGGAKVILKQTQHIVHR